MFFNRLFIYNEINALVKLETLIGVAIFKKYFHYSHIKEIEIINKFISYHTNYYIFI